MRFGKMALGIGFVLAASYAHADTLTTTFSNNNSGRNGLYFDLSAANALTVDSFDINVSSDTSVDVYYKTGSAFGSETDASAFTLLGSGNVISAGTDTPSHLNVGGLTLNAGQTDGIYMFFNNSGAVNYTDGFTTFSNADLTIAAGTGNFGRFENTLAERIWNGNVNYTLTTAVPEPGSVAMLAGMGLSGAGFLARRRRNAHKAA